MRDLSTFSEIYLCREFVDMRKSYGSLSLLAQSEFGADWKKSQIFVFINRRRNLLKILYFDRTGFALWIKRLEESKFPWPKSSALKFIKEIYQLEALYKTQNLTTEERKILRPGLRIINQKFLKAQSLELQSITNWMSGST